MTPPDMAFHDDPANDNAPRRQNVLVWAFCAAFLLLGIYLGSAVAWLRGWI